jgi:hypothetical protein
MRFMQHGATARPRPRRIVAAKGASLSPVCHPPEFCPREGHTSPHRERRKERPVKEECVQRDDQRDYNRGHRGGQAVVDQYSHHVPVTAEGHQRDEGERYPEGEYHLAYNQGAARVDPYTWIIHEFITQSLPMSKKRSDEKNGVSKNR